jgi:hypothetical protein
MNKNLILSYIRNPKSTVDLCPFAKSVSQFLDNYDCLVINSSDQNLKATTKYLEENGIKVLEREKEIPSLYVDRFKAYLDLINTLNYESILCLDLTDIVIQKNPFEFLQIPNDNNVTVTSECLYIKQSEWNSTIIKSAYGEKILREIEHQDILNSGIIAGGRKGLSRLFEKMVEDYENMGPSREITGMDQGILNKIIHRDGFETEYSKPPFAINMHVCLNFKETRNFMKIDSGRVLAEDGSQYAIVHQYNRKKDLKESFLEIFGCKST